MSGPVVGVDIDDFHLETKAALRCAADLQFRVIEVATVEGDLSPSRLSASGRRHLVRLAGGLGLQFGALVADMRHLRLSNASTVDERVSRTCAVLDLARDMGVRCVTAAVGLLTDTDSGAPDEIALEALSRIGEHADARGVGYAIRPALDSGDRLGGVLDALRCPAIRVCLDPAAMVMQGVNPLASVEQWIEHASMLHVRDATAGLDEHAGHETPLGQGDVDLIGVLATLDAADLSGPYILRRTDAALPVDDLSAARDTLTELMPPG